MKLDFWFLHSIEYFDGLRNDQAQKYASCRPNCSLNAKKNGLKKYVQSSLKSHLLWVTLYMELAVVSHIAETLKETDQS